jgi:hypothetical protein
MKQILKKQIKKFCEENNLFFDDKNLIIYDKNDFFLFYIICDFKPSCCEIGVYFTPLFIPQEELTLTFGNTISFLTSKVNLELSYSLAQNTINKRLNKNLIIALDILKEWHSIINPNFVIKNIDRAKYTKIFYTEDLWKWELLGYCYGILGNMDVANFMFSKLIGLYSNNQLNYWENKKLEEWKYVLEMIYSNQFDNFIEKIIYNFNKQFLNRN